MTANSTYFMVMLLFMALLALIMLVMPMFLLLEIPGNSKVLVNCGINVTPKVETGNLNFCHYLVVMFVFMSALLVPVLLVSVFLIPVPKMRLLKTLACATFSYHFFL